MRQLTKVFTHINLMYHCWRRNWYGDLKGIEIYFDPLLFISDDYVK